MIRFFIIFIVVFIVSCANIKNDSCKVNGGEYYLDTNKLCEIHFPVGCLLPPVDEKYKIPNVIDDGQLKIGKNLDICPPSAAY